MDRRLRFRRCLFLLTVCILAVSLLLSGCCGGLALDEEGATPPGLSAGQSRCGDGVCDGPENEQNCPADCAASANCNAPNPQRALVQDLVEWHNWLEDGGFEAGQTEIIVTKHSQGALSLGQAVRSTEAARLGSYGYALIAGANQGLTFSVRSYLDKPEGVRFSFWARSPGGEATLQPTVTWVERGNEDQPGQLHIPEQTFVIGPDWTQVSFETEVSKILRYALLNIEVGPNTALHIDDVRIEQELWQMAEYADDSRVVGGIPVPTEPVAPTHFSVLIHIEDPTLLQTSEGFFQGRSAVFTELARLLHEHGGFLTIQPEEDWVMAAERFAPGLLEGLAQDYGVQYSTHTHGPHCRDDEGRLRSCTDCEQNKYTAGWDQSVNDYDYPEVIEYVGNLQGLISEAAGISVTDHNGNWECDRATELSKLGYETWSAYKNWETQRTYQVLINNPWRPGQVNADDNAEQWLTHDPSTDIVYIPGWGQNLTRWHERAQEKLAPILSQWISHADPDRVNTFYLMLHVGIFDSRYQEGDDTYTVFDDTAGTLTLSDEFNSQMAYWDKLLTELIDPLVTEGYLQWTSLPEMGELYLQWEQDSCHGEASPAVQPD